jgi:hypothetical protein
MFQITFSEYSSAHSRVLGSGSDRCHCFGIICLLHLQDRAIKAGDSRFLKHIGFLLPNSVTSQKLAMLIPPGEAQTSRMDLLLLLLLLLPFLPLSLSLSQLHATHCSQCH